MPFLMHLAALSHCLVGLGRAWRISSDSSSSSFLYPALSIFIFAAISSAAFSAPLLVFTKTRACFFLSRVSRTRSIAGLSVGCFISSLLDSLMIENKEHLFKYFWLVCHYYLISISLYLFF